MTVGVVTVAQLDVSRDFRRGRPPCLPIPRATTEGCPLSFRAHTGVRPTMRAPMGAPLQSLFGRSRAHTGVRPYDEGAYGCTLTPTLEAIMDASLPDRRSIRLRGYDYSQPGAYFVTICVQDRQCLFGEIVESEMRLNDAGRMVQTAWEELPRQYQGVATDEFVVMPNHVHGIIVLVGADPRVCPSPGLTGAHRGAPLQVRSTWGAPLQVGPRQGVTPTNIEQPQQLSLPTVVQRFKTLTTKRYMDSVNHYAWLPFPGRLWQRNYYEHIIRDEESLQQIRQYVFDNPARWAFDRENPTVNPQ